MIRVLISVLWLVVCVTLYAAEPSPGPTLSQQIQSIREQAEVIESFRMVKAYQVENFWKAVQDTIKLKNADMLELQNQIVAYEQDLVKLKKSMEEKDQAASDSQFNAEHIQVFGRDIAKGKFIWIVSLTGIGLLVLLGFVFAAFKMSYRATRDAQGLYDEVCRDFEAYKKKMVEKEVKLCRELQDYRNKVMELKSA